MQNNTSIQIFEEALNKATYDYIKATNNETLDREVDALLSCLVLYTHKLINNSFPEDKHFYGAMDEYIRVLTNLGKSRVPLVVIK